MFHYPGTELYLSTKQYVLDHEDELDSSWACVHIGTELFYREYDGANNECFQKDSHIYARFQDVPDPHYFNLKVIKTILEFIDNQLSSGKKVLIHCDYGQSRSPSILMTYVSKYTAILPKDFLSAVEVFSKIYPDYVYPSGISIFLKREWDRI